jgi:HAD superfamily hydrolase (TIGR01509 family)
MIKNIAFDLDGVLFDGCDLHASLFIEAVSQVKPDIILSKEYHDTILNGLPTKEKLRILNIVDEEAKQIYTIKQELTNAYLSTLPPSKKNITLCEELKQMGYDIYCVSNSIRTTIETVLSRMGILHMFSGIISNNDVRDSKPSPVPYLTLFSRYNIDPNETMILEDSEFGILSATQSGAYTLCVRNCDDVTKLNILTTIEKIRLTPSVKKYLSYEPV